MRFFKLSFIFFIVINCLLLSAEEISKDSKKGIIIKKEEKEAVKDTRNLDKIEAYAQSTRWAIIVGINDYEDKFIADLSKAQNDAKVLTDILKNEGQFDHVYTFTDDTDKKSETYPSLNNIVAKLDFLKGEIKQNDTVLFCFSGHGISDDKGQSFLVMADTVISQPYKTALPLYEVENWIKEMKVSKNIVMLDACRNVLEKTKAINTKTLIDERNSQAEISAVVYATSPGEFSYEHDKEPYGVFTTFIIDGLRGKADKDNDVMVTFGELRDYVENGVRQWALNHNKKQKPYTSIKGEFHGDVVLSVIPLKERAKYNPNVFMESYTRRYQAYQAMNYSSIGLIAVSAAGCAVGYVIGGIGYYKYQNLPEGAPEQDFDTYFYMQSGGFATGFAFSGVLGASLIPLIVSYAVKPKAKAENKFSFDINCKGDSFAIGARIKLN